MKMLCLEIASLGVAEKGCFPDLKETKCQYCLVDLVHEGTGFCLSNSVVCCV